MTSTWLFSLIPSRTWEWKRREGWSLLSNWTSMLEHCQEIASCIGIPCTRDICRVAEEAISSPPCSLISQEMWACFQVSSPVETKLDFSTLESICLVMDQDFILQSDYTTPEDLTLWLEKVFFSPWAHTTHNLVPICHSYNHTASEISFMGKVWRVCPLDSWWSSLPFLTVWKSQNLPVWWAHWIQSAHSPL